MVTKPSFTAYVKQSYFKTKIKLLMSEDQGSKCRSGTIIIFKEKNRTVCLLRRPSKQS